MQLFKQIMHLAKLTLIKLPSLLKRSFAHFRFSWRPIIFRQFFKERQIARFYPFIGLPLGTPK